MSQERISEEMELEELRRRRRMRAQKRKKQRRRKLKINRVLFILCFISFLTSTILFVSSYITAENEKNELTQLAILVSESEEAINDPVITIITGSELIGSNPANSEAEATASVPDNRERFAELVERNNDFIGWLSIDGTAINYPVMYTPEEPEYYLQRDFDKNSSKSGIPFIGEGCTIESDNILLYGHNMKNGTMFSDLLKFRDKEYWEQHPYISFDTLERSANYEIIAAFPERVHTKDETNVFRYYEYGGTLSEKEFNEYLEHVKKIALYDTGITAAYGDQLISLSTCAYHTENGRFVVVAKRIDTE